MSGRTRKSRRLLAAFLALLVIGIYVAIALLQPLMRLNATSDFTFSARPQPATLTWPSFGEGAVGAVGYGVLATHGEQKALPTASSIKVLTALAVLKQKPLAAGEDGPMIAITSEDVQAYNKQLALNGSVVAVTDGEQLSERQALEALLLPSANNMADTLARWAFGSVDQYLTFANTYAKELGMQHTTITDPSGLDASTVSTPSDLVTLGEGALANPVVTAIVREPTATIPVQGSIKNYNALLGLRGIVGIKTGNNDADPGCFMLAAERTVGGQKLTIIAVLMNAPNLDDALYQTLPLLYSVEHSFVPLTIAPAGKPIARYAVPWGAPAPITPANDLTYVAWIDSQTTTSLVLDTLAGATTSKRAVGSLIVHNSRLKKSAIIPLQLAQPITSPSVLWRLAHPF